ncbi:hypothetical protein P3102_02890 [Amycolatopsis sp. QT-25]|uniref:hypothetical protein n=1 Tax=Amycolatopsis sp. QT-25 TaxID=3034022 RepID=UPI0023EB25B4|nr:hypothetical protein [Amycolatopsis sp. QT-25]WET80216.1 hypothetical protein P3102_02890 [Amycolatopsis sp. QT-25]
MAFTEEEIAYLRSQPLARFATLSEDGEQPDVVPLAFEFDGTHFWVGGVARRSSRPGSSATSKQGTAKSPC